MATENKQLQIFVKAFTTERYKRKLYLSLQQLNRENTVHSDLKQGLPHKRNGRR